MRYWWFQCTFWNIDPRESSFSNLANLSLSLYIYIWYMYIYICVSYCGHFRRIECWQRTTCPTHLRFCAIQKHNTCLLNSFEQGPIEKECLYFYHLLSANHHFSGVLSFGIIDRVPLLSVLVSLNKRTSCWQFSCSNNAFPVLLWQDIFISVPQEKPNIDPPPRKKLTYLLLSDIICSSSFGHLQVLYPVIVDSFRSKARGPLRSTCPRGSTIYSKHATWGWFSLGRVRWQKLQN